MYSISSKTGKSCIITASLTRSHFECISLGLSFFLSFPQTWWKADLRPQAGSTLIINTKDGHSTGRALQGGTLLYAPRSRAGCLSSKCNPERLLFATWKETFWKTGCKELTEEDLQSGKLECNVGLSWTSVVKVSQPASLLCKMRILLILIP